MGISDSPSCVGVGNHRRALAPGSRVHPEQGWCRFYELPGWVCSQQVAPLLCGLWERPPNRAAQCRR